MTTPRKCTIGVDLAVRVFLTVAVISMAVGLIHDFRQWSAFQDWCTSQGGQTVGSDRDVCIGPDRRVIPR